MVERLVLDRKVIAALPQDERKALLAFSHASNEIAILQRSLLMTLPRDSGQDESNVQQSLFFFHLRMLAGKCFEAYRLLQRVYLGQVLGRDNQQYLSRRGVDCLDRIKKAFGKGGIIAKVRNNFSNHYSPDLLEERFWKEDGDLTMYFDRDHNVNTLYHFAEELINAEIWDGVEATDRASAMLQVHTEVRSTSRDIMVFMEEFLASLVEKHRLRAGQDDIRNIECEQLLDLRDCRFNWFVDPRGLAELLKYTPLTPPRPSESEESK